MSRKLAILLTALVATVEAKAELLGSGTSCVKLSCAEDPSIGRSYGLNALSCLPDPRGLDIRLERVEARQGGEGLIEVRGVVRNYSHQKLDTPLHLRVSNVKGDGEKHFLLAPELPSLGSRTFLVNYFGKQKELKLLLAFNPAKSCTPVTVILSSK